jgi:CheY-like chemotaxis protein
MAAAIWSATGGRGATPSGAVDAASDLAELYERMNNADLTRLADRFPGGLSGEDLVAFAMTPGQPFVTQMKVPRFAVSLDGDELEWDGGERDIRNPARRNGDSDELWVLLIEDEPSKQVSTTRMIKRLYPNAQVIVSDNGPAAIANLEAHDVKLVISDVDILGTMSGVDVFKWVRANQPNLVDGYVFFSGNDAGDLYEDGVPIHYRILQKPAGTKDLGEAIRAPGPQRPTIDLSGAIR